MNTGLCHMVDALSSTVSGINCFSSHNLGDSCGGGCCVSHGTQARELLPMVPGGQAGHSEGLTALVLVPSKKHSWFSRKRAGGRV